MSECLGQYVYVEAEDGGEYGFEKKVPHNPPLVDFDIIGERIWNDLSPIYEADFLRDSWITFVNQKGDKYEDEAWVNLSQDFRQFIFDLAGEEKFEGRVLNNRPCWGLR